MEKEIKEIPFGSKDSVLNKFEYTIPEGYEAEIKDGKVIVKKKESEDERIRKALIKQFSQQRSEMTFGDSGLTFSEIVAHLEKQKEREDKLYEKTKDRFYKEGVDDGILIGKEQQKEQKPAEWSEEDEYRRQQAIDALERNGYNVLADWLKSLRPQPKRRDTYYDIIHDILATLKDIDFMKITPEHRVSLLNDIRVKCKNADECAAILDEPHWKPSEEQRHIEGQDTCYLNKQSLVTFIEDCIAENLENTTDANHDNHEGYHQACWDIIYRINQMCK